LEDHSGEVEAYSGEAHPGAILAVDIEPLRKINYIRISI
jgi:hypothetical protein